MDWEKRRKEIINLCLTKVWYNEIADEIITQEQAMLKKADTKIRELEKLLTYHKGGYK